MNFPVYVEIVIDIIKQTGLSVVTVGVQEFNHHDKCKILESLKFEVKYSIEVVTRIGHVCIPAYFL